MEALKRRVKKNHGGSKGSSQNMARRTNATNAAAPPPSAPRVSGAVHVRLGASMIAHSSSPSPAMDSSAPSGSARLDSGLRELGTSQRVATRPAMAMGTLIRKTDPHQ